MKRLIVLLIVAVAFIHCLFPQAKYKLANENVVSKSAELKEIQDDRIYRLFGSNKNQIVYQLNLRNKNKYGDLSSEAVVKLFYDEKIGRVVDSITIKRKGRNVLDFVQLDNVTVYHGFYQVPSKYENKTIDDLDRGEYLQDYQDFWIELNGNEKKIKSFPMHYFDKEVYFNICHTRDCIVLNEYVSTYLRSTKSDSIITVFNFQNGQIASKEFTCKECIKPQIVNEQLFYGKKFYYFPGTDAYDWNIYRTDKFDIPNSELLAEYIEILLVSPDGKYILGKKNLQGKDVAVILDVDAKKFDYLLGRDYLQFDYFFSPAYKKFAFDTENHIIYINYPNEFPFNSIGEDAERKRTSKSEKAVFWEKYNYPALEQH